jgi:type I restriction enzyme S subunit
LFSKDGTVGRTAVVDCDRDFVVASSLVIISPRDRRLNSSFLNYWLNNAFLQQDIVLQMSGAALRRISVEKVSRLPVFLPPLAEQETIALFLDAETKRINRLIEKERELIERLKEKRSALISHTVTRGLPTSEAVAAGLPPNPALKASGVEWLGDVPEHWEIKQLKWAIMFQRGHDLPSDEREEGAVPLVTSAGISAFVSRAAARGPGIVTGRYGTIGEFYLIEEDYWPLNTTLYSIELRENHPAFLRYMLIHLAPLFLLNAVKSAVPGVDRNDIHPTTAAVPPPAEQAAIAAYLDSETRKLDALMAKVDEAIERLREYRRALITAAVTGKIDVRKAAA